LSFRNLDEDGEMELEKEGEGEGKDERRKKLFAKNFLGGIFLSIEI